MSDTPEITITDFETGLVTVRPMSEKEWQDSQVQSAIKLEPEPTPEEETPTDEVPASDDAGALSTDAG